MMAATEATYSTNEIARISGVSLRQLQFWDEQGVLCPRHEGHARVYDHRDALRLIVIAELRRKGISLQKIRKVTADGIPSKSRWLATDGRRSYFEETHWELIRRLCESKNPMHVVDLRAAWALVAGKPGGHV